MFKQCTLCRRLWPKREDFLADPNLEIIGYQACFDSISEGLFLFNHLCETTLALKVHDFEDLHEGIRYDAALRGTDGCGGFCLQVEELKACMAQCKYAYVRDIIQIIRKWPKS